MSMNRVDSHQHFWSLARGDYDWMSPDLAPIYRDFTPDDLAPFLDKHGIRYTVVVQAAATVAETEFLLALANKHDSIAGVVGWVDMESPDAISELQRFSENPKFVGIRPMIQDIQDPNWMLNEKLTTVFNWLQEKQLTFDALIKPEHINNLTELLARHPTLNAVVDHGAKPSISRNEFNQWADDIESLAFHTRATCKLSGLLTEAAPGADADDLAPYINHLLTSFGPSRLMWGSDWPVLNLAADYSYWVSLCESALASLPETEQQMIWHHNAVRFYRLSV